MKALALALILMVTPGLWAVTTPSPFSNSVFPAQTFTATNQTGATIQLNGVANTSTVGSSFSVGTLTVTGTSLTTVTFSVYGSADNGATFYALPIITVASPSTVPSTTITVTTNGLYQVGIAGITHVKFLTSGTFTATNVNLVLTATPNAAVSPVVTGGTSGGGVIPSAQYKLPQYNAPGTSVQGSNVTTDSTGNNLTVPGSTSTPNLNNVYYVTPSTNLQTFLTAIGSNVHVILPPGTYTLSSTLQIYNNNVDFDCQGGVLLITTTTTDGIQIGNPSIPFDTTATNTRFRNCAIKPGAQQTAGAMIHDNGSGTLIDNLTIVPNGSNYFLNGIQVDQDQSFQLTGFYVAGQVLGCTSSYCGSLLYNPANSANAAVGWVSNSLFAPQCAGNGVDWQGGNDLHITSTIIEGFSQFGIRLNGAASGADLKALFSKVHIEQGNCTNPWYINPNTSAPYQAGAGIIANVVSVSNFLGHDSVLPVQFPLSGTSGSEVYYYYVVVHGSTTQTAPMEIGEVLNGNATISGSNYVNVTFPSIATATSCDVLRYDATSNTEQGPFGTGNWAVASALSCNSGNVTTFTDNVASPSSYSLTTTNAWVFTPYLNFWPGFVTLAGNGHNTYRGEELSFVAYSAESPHGEVFQLEPGTLVDNTSTKIPPPYIDLLGTIAGNSVKTTPGVSGFLWPGSNPITAVFGSNTKGVINFGTSFGSTGYDLLTIYDSNFLKTVSNRQHMPSWDANDSAIGVDPSTPTAMYERAGSTISWYIGAVPDGMSWLMKLFSTTLVLQTPEHHWNQTDIWYSDSGTTPTLKVLGSTGQVQVNNALAACTSSFSHCAFFEYNPASSASVTVLAPPAGGTLAVSMTLPTGTPTFTAGTGVTSVACTSSYTCTNQRGELTLVGGSATTGTIATLDFSTTLSVAPGLCMVTQVGGATSYGLGHGVPVGTSFTITAANSVSSATVTMDYSCLP